MSVEAPGVSISKGVAPVSGPAISVGAPSFETAPVVVNLEPSFSLVKEGPVTPEALNNMNIIARPINSVIQQAEQVAVRAWEATKPAEIEIRQPQVETVVVPAESGSLSAASAVAEAEYWLAMHQADRVQAARVIEVATQAGIKPAVARRWVVNALPKEQTQTAPETQTLTKLVSEEIDRPTLKQEEEQILRQESRQESSEKVVPVYEEDEETLAYRLAKAKAVIANLYAGNKNSTIDGSSISSALGEESDKDRSRVFKQLGINDVPDGSYTNWRHEVRSWPKLDLKTAFKRAQEAGQRHLPIKLGKGGRSAPPQNVAEVFNRQMVDIKPAVKRLATQVKKVVIFKSATSPQMIFEERQELVEQQEDPASIETSVQVVEKKIEYYHQLAEVFKQAV